MNHSVNSRVGPLDGLPILVVGNKCDTALSRTLPQPKVPWDKNYDSIATSALAPTPDGHLPDEEKILEFFNRVALRRFG